MIYCMHLLESKCRLYTTPNWNLPYLIWNYCPFVYVFWWRASRNICFLRPFTFFEELHQNFGEAPQKRSNAYSIYYKLFGIMSPVDHLKIVSTENRFGILANEVVVGQRNGGLPICIQRHRLRIVMFFTVFFLENFGFNFAVDLLQDVFWKAHFLEWPENEVNLFLYMHLPA